MPTSIIKKSSSKRKWRIDLRKYNEYITNHATEQTRRLFDEPCWTKDREEYQHRVCEQYRDRESPSRAASSIGSTSTRWIALRSTFCALEFIGNTKTRRVRAQAPNPFLQKLRDQRIHQNRTKTTRAMLFTDCDSIGLFIAIEFNYF